MTHKKQDEELEAQLAQDLKHTLKLVPQSQRELFTFELARYITERGKKRDAYIIGSDLPMGVDETCAKLLRAEQRKRSKEVI